MCFEPRLFALRAALAADMGVSISGGYSVVHSAVAAGRTSVAMGRNMVGCRQHCSLQNALSGGSDISGYYRSLYPTVGGSLSILCWCRTAAVIAAGFCGLRWTL